ncbi:hypothetical protein [Amycolatopsis solani]|uniref:hypothetical protein n=1 Tax=Amycolatopsis solani TaxID=3028615 RepID=UPI00296FF11D|nr:hypothetical protein [Amycolatopsis sp. MEP2-6]
MNRVDPSGRVGDRPVLMTLGWAAGDGIAVTADGTHVLIFRREDGCPEAVIRHARGAIPASLRRRCDIGPRDRGPPPCSGVRAGMWCGRQLRSADELGVDLQLVAGRCARLQQAEVVVLPQVDDFSIASDGVLVGQCSGARRRRRQRSDMRVEELLGQIRLQRSTLPLWRGV